MTHQFKCLLRPLDHLLIFRYFSSALVHFVPLLLVALPILILLAQVLINHFLDLVIRSQLILQPINRLLILKPLALPVRLVQLVDFVSELLLAATLLAKVQSQAIEVFPNYWLAQYYLDCQCLMSRLM